MTEPFALRAKARRAIQRYLQKRSFPRLTLGLILLVTGGLGFFLSFLLLRLGMDHMWARYPLAVLGAYAGFLGLIRAWVELERRSFDPSAPELRRGEDGEDDDSTEESSHRLRNIADQVTGTGKENWADILDLSMELDFDDGCLPLILIGVVVGLAAALIVTLANAPALLAEVFLDAVVLSLLYRRLRAAAREHWLGTAIRRTWRMVALVAVLLSIGGWALEEMAPGARSLGPAIRRLIHGESTQAEAENL